jgi:hypothetical protein
MNKTTKLMSLAAVALMCSFGAQAQELGNKFPQAAEQNPDGPNALTRSAVQRGILQCAARVEQVSKFLGFGSQASGLLLAPASPTDQRLFSISMEVPAGATLNTLADMQFAPNQANGCGASYQTISYYAQSCDQMASSLSSQYKAMPPLKRDVAVLDGGPASKVFLIRAGDAGCVVVKKELVL